VLSSSAITARVTCLSMVAMATSLAKVGPGGAARRTPGATGWGHSGGGVRRGARSG